MKVVRAFVLENAIDKFGGFDCVQRLDLALGHMQVAEGEVLCEHFRTTSLSHPRPSTVMVPCYTAVAAGT